LLKQSNAPSEVIKSCMLFVEESYQFRIDKLEKENKLMRELAETLSHQIKAINDILDSV